MRVARGRRKWARAKARNRAIRAQQRKTTRRRSTSRLAATPRPAMVTTKRTRQLRRMTIKIQTGNCGVGDGFRSHLVALDERIHDALPHFPRRELAVGSRVLP